MEVLRDGNGVPSRKHMGPVEVLWDGDKKIPSGKDMGPVEVLWDEMGCVNRLKT